MSALPIKFQELFNMTTVGINQQFIGFNSVAMESEKFITVREEAGAVNVVVIDMAKPRQPNRRPMSADAVLMHPNTQVMALRARDANTGVDNVQVFNLEMKSKVGTFAMPEQVVFWKWINAQTLALVTATSIYHWSSGENSDPKLMFKRFDQLNNCQIISYRVDPTGDWACVVGITRGADQRIAGVIQLHSFKRNQSQPLPGHAAAFLPFTDHSSLFVFSTRDANGAKLNIVEVGDNTSYAQKSIDVFYPPDAAQDFPVGLQVGPKYNVAYLLTQQGYIHVFDMMSGTLIFNNRISKDPIFLTTQSDSNSGVLCINRRGQVLQVTIDEANVVQHIAKSLGNSQLAFEYAQKNNLPGAEEMFSEQFMRQLQAQNYREAALIARSSPQGFLRTQQTLERFKVAPAVPNAPAPLLQYFSVLLETTNLNKAESIELTRFVLQQGKKQLVENWLKQEKLECSEELGDLVKTVDQMLALSIYLRANVPNKVIACFAEAGQYDRIIMYAKKVDFKPDYGFLLSNIIRVNPSAAVEFARRIVNDETGPLCNLNQVIDAFVQRNMVPEATSIMLDHLKANREEDGQLQTRVLEINLIAAPQVGKAILDQQMFAHYDRARIAQLCEKAGLGMHALEHYTELEDIKRVLVQQGPMMNDEFVVTYFGNLSADVTLECIKALLQQHTPRAMQIAVNVSARYVEQLTAPVLIGVFEQFNSTEGMFYFLNSFVDTTEDAEVVFKYIEVATKLNNFKEVNRVCRENSTYEPAKVKDFFMKLPKLADPVPLIIVCDRFDFVDELTRFLFKHDMLQKLEVYVQKVNPLRAPVVVGALIDSNCDEARVKKLIMSLKNMCPVEELVEQVEKRNRLKLLQSWLEERVDEGNQDPAAHNALAKIYVDANIEPEEFLKTNQFYDSVVVGKYCEKRDPHLAFIAYKRGQCDDELIDVTNRSQLFKQQARYLVERQSLELWEKVLGQENEKFRKSVIDQVVSTALPETKNAEAVSTTVKAFMNAGLPNHLIELLEKIVLENSDFSDNKNLQNLLILTAIKADQSRVMDYINRLDNFDGVEIAPIALHANLFEEALVIYQKFEEPVEAVLVLLEHIGDLERAYEFAERMNKHEVWSKLAIYQLKAKQVPQAIESFIKADDPSDYQNVIFQAGNTNCWEDLVKFLTMARQKIKDPEVDSEMVFALARCDRLSDIEEFINNANVANLEVCGDRCFAASLFEAARVLFDFIQNWGRLASTYIRLERYQNAVEAARKANKIQTWKEVNAACVHVKEFKLAQQAAQHIIIHPDELDELVHFYEVRGYFDEVIAVLEQGKGNERAHTGLFTVLGICYSKFHPEKLMEHLKWYIQRVSIPRLVRVCEANLQWKALTFLHKNYNEYDNAALTMMEHSPEAWDDAEFKEVIVKVGNSDIMYKAINFYLEEHADLVNPLLSVLTPKVDHVRVVQNVRKAKMLPLIKPYLLAVQPQNIGPVNEAVNELLVEEEDFEALRTSIDTYSNFDNIALARACERNDLIKFREIGAYLYKKNKRYPQSVELSKRDRLWQTAMETAAESKDVDVAEGLLRFFVDEKLNECFAATLFTCYDLLRPDVVLELAWKNNVLNFAMPYLVQMLREYTGKIDELEKKLNEHQVKVEKKEEQEAAVAEEEAASRIYADVTGLPTMYPPQSFIPDAAAMGFPMSGYIPPM